MRNSRIFGLRTFDRFFVGGELQFTPSGCPRADQAWTRPTGGVRAKDGMSKKGVTFSPSKTKRCYKNVTRKIALVGFAASLQFATKPSSKIGNNSFEMSLGLGKYNFRFFTDCSGGNSSPSYPADAGGCIF
jgi:hypothetical protein